MHGEDGGVLGAVRTQEGRPFRLLSCLPADVDSPSQGVAVLGEEGITPSRTPTLQGLSVAVFRLLSVVLAMICSLMEGVTVAGTSSLSSRCLH